MAHAIATFDEAYAAIWNRSGWDRGFISNPFAGDEAARLGLQRTRELLDAIGNPERNVPLVHVAGSKGKGSSCALVDGIFRAAGLHSGRFLSPHLHTIRERFVVDDTMIDDAEFVSIVALLMDATAKVEREHPDIGQLTAWELSTALALEWFSRRQCDAAVIEVGMGGLLDATNVITPVVSAITRLDYEHTAILGNTMEEIAANKAGIIKPGVPAVTVDQPAEGAAVIAERAKVAGSVLLVDGRDWHTVGTHDRFDVNGNWWTYRDLALSMPGNHQMENAGLAIAACQVFGQSAGVTAITTDDAVRSGVRSASLPGRFERITTTNGVQVILDGAHTPESMRALVDTVVAQYPGAGIIAVVGMLGERDPAEVVPPLARAADRLIVTAPANPRAVPPDSLLASLAGLVPGIIARPTVPEALGLALDNAAVDASVVVVSGSFSVVAEARVHLGLA